MEKPCARRATAWPISPPPPTKPIVFPQTKEPSRWLDWPPGNFPARTRRSPSMIRRATASISPKVRSAVASVVTGGTTVTGSRCAVAAATSMFEGEMDCAATSRSFGLAAITSRSMRSCNRQNRMSHVLTAATSAFLAMIRLESGLTLTVPTLRRRSIALLAIGWVTKIRGRAGLGRIRRSIARRRRRRRLRPASRRGCGWWRRARPAPSGCRARARARRDARSSRRARRPRRRRAAAHG